MPAFFHNRLLMLVLMLGMGLGIASSVYAETVPAKVELLNPQHNQAVAPPATHTETAPAPVRAELLEKLQDRVIELEKETAVLKAELGTRIDAQDNRIADGIGLHGAEVTKLSNQTSMLGVEVAVLGGLIAFVTIFAAIAGYFSFSQAAKNAVAAARDEVIRESESWFARNDDKLRKEIDQLTAKASQACDTIDEHREGVANVAKEAKADIERTKASLKLDNDLSAVGVPVVTQQSMQALEDKPRTEWSAEDFHLKVRELFANKDYVKALESTSIQIYLLEASSKPVEKVLLAKALLNKGVILWNMNSIEGALAAFDDFIKCFSDYTEPAIHELMAKALLYKGIILGETDRPEEALAIYDRLIMRFSNSHEPVIFEVAAEALFNKGVTHERMGRPADALVAYDELINRFSNSPDPVLREWVAKALINKGITLGQLKHPKDELAAYEDFMCRFGDSHEPALREWVAKALFYKGISLWQLNRSEDALAAYEELIRRFGNSTEPELLEVVEQARLKFGGES